MRNSELTRVQKLKVVAKAKRIYKKGLHTGMCPCIEDALVHYKHITQHEADAEFDFNYTKEFIPEFNVEWLDAPFECGYWWTLGDKESRMKAFDKLIKYYEHC